jgi:hypothetical protein
MYRADWGCMISATVASSALVGGQRIPSRRQARFASREPWTGYACGSRLEHDLSVTPTFLDKLVAILHDAISSSGTRGHASADLERLRIWAVAQDPAHGLYSVY